MKKVGLILYLFFNLLQLRAQQNILSGKFSLSELNGVLISQESWHPFPKPDDISAWKLADQEKLRENLKKAERYLSYSWPSIPATKSLLIVRNGNRSEYESLNFEKRKVLGIFLLAEVYENKGRFLDDIINGVWSVCEESYWGVPAHLPKNKEIAGLADVSQPFVELFSAETATYLSWIDYFLGDKLDAISPQIRKRIYLEIDSRIFQPLMHKPHRFMSINERGRRPNNWNPWICSNWINAALLIEKDEAKRVAMVAKALHVLDQFLNPYPQDGGCDEGPGYWGAAAASLYDNIAILNLASNDAFDYAFQNEKIKNMAKFIYRAQIGKEYFLNFADADPRPQLDGSLIYRFGKDINDPELAKFGVFYFNKKEENGDFHFFRHLFALFIGREITNTSKALPLPKDVWFPDLQVMIARDKQGSEKGLFLAVKGGNNDESHNHNDIGNYVVYYNGLPLIIDVGRGTYTSRTFSDKRYDIWFNCSPYHNVPSVNKQTQLAGSQFKAHDVSYESKKAYARFSLDLVGAYPKEAGINSWRRTVQLNRGRNIEVNNSISLKKAEGLVEHVMTCYPSEIVAPGRLIIHFIDSTQVVQDFLIRYDDRHLAASVEKVALVNMEDKGVREKWGDRIYRINFSVKAPETNDQIRFTIEKI